MYIPLINATVNQLMDSTAHVRTEAVVSRSDRAAKIELWALATRSASSNIPNSWIATVNQDFKSYFEINEGQFSVPTGIYYHLLENYVQASRFESWYILIVCTMSLFRLSSVHN